MSGLRDSIRNWASPEDIERDKKQRVLEAEVINAARDWYHSHGSMGAIDQLRRAVEALHVFWGNPLRREVPVGRGLDRPLAAPIPDKPVSWSRTYPLGRTKAGEAVDKIRAARKGTP